MKKDIITKETIQAITYDIATYILKIDISRDFKFIDKELQTIEKREADIVVLYKKDNEEKILHLEIQNSNDYTMPNRMLRYYVDIKSKYPKTEINQYLLYIGKEKLYMKDTIKDKNLSFQYSLVDMHNIDCEEFIKIDTPDALVLSILCDFKDKKDLDVLVYITQRLQELTKDDEHSLSKYMLILETLSQNRNLKDKLKKAEDMLRKINFEQLPSYEIGMERGIERGMERGIERGMEKGIERGKLETALLMIEDFKINPEEVSSKLDIPLNELLKRL